MNKYIAPVIEIEEIEGSDVIATSGGVSVAALDGVDTEDSKSAIFDASFWLFK